MRLPCAGRHSSSIGRPPAPPPFFLAEEMEAVPCELTPLHSKIPLLFHAHFLPFSLFPEELFLFCVRPALIPSPLLPPPGPTLIHYSLSVLHLQTFPLHPSLALWLHTHSSLLQSPLPKSFAQLPLQ